MNRKLLALLWAVIVATGAVRPASAGTEPGIYVVSPNGHSLRDAVLDTGLNRIFALEVREGPRVERLIAFDLATRTVIGDLPLSNGYLSDRPRIAIDPATHTLYVLQVLADRTSRVTVIDGTTLTVTATAAGPDLRLIRAGFHLPSLSFYASPQQTGELGLHEISLEPATLGQSRAFIPTPDMLKEIAVHEATRRIYAIGLTGGVFAIDGQTRQVVASAPITGRYIAVDQNTRQVYLTTGTSVVMLDPDTLGTVSTIAVPQLTSNAPAPVGVAVNSTLGRAYVGVFSELRTLVVDGAAAEIEHVLAVAGGVSDGGAILPNETNGHVYVVQGTRIIIVDDVYAPGSPKVTTTTGNKQVTLDWSWTTDGGSTIAAYEILVDGAVVATVGGETTSHVLSGLQNGTSHKFEVRPVNAVGAGPAAGENRAAGEPHAVTVGAGPSGIAVDVAANIIYVANSESDSVSVVDGVTWTVIDTIAVGDMPTAIAVDQSTRRVVVANRLGNTVSVIDGGTRAVIATVPVGNFPWGIAVDPATHAVYVANTESDTVTVIDGNTNTVVHTVPVGDAPIAVVVNPATHAAYVVNVNSRNVSIIDASFAVTGLIPIGGENFVANVPLTLAIDPVTQMVFVGGRILGPDFGPVFHTIDGTTNTAGPTLSAAWLWEWSLEALAINSATGWAYTIWNAALGDGQGPAPWYFDNRFDARGLVFTGSRRVEYIATDFTDRLQSVAVDDTRNIVYVTGTRDGQGILISYTGARRDQTVGISGQAAGPIGGQVPLVTTGGATGNPVTLSVDPSSDPNVCSIGGGSVVSLSAEGTCVIRATQQGDDNFNAGIATHTIEVGLPAQTISFDGPGAGVVGGSATLEAIGGGSLNPVVFAVDESTAPGVCAVSGNVVSYTAAGTCIIVATQAGNAEYLPADPVTRSVVVVPAGAVISWPNPAPIVHGTALDESQLNASANVPGTFTYSPAAGTVLDAGSHVLTVTFTPDDSVNYIAGMASVTIDVAQATVMIAWPRPETISYGTPLGAEQLNATTDLPGTFVYSPAAGEVLEVGLQTLSVTFTPDDATNYAPTTAVTLVTVDRARPTITWPQPAPIVYGTPLGDAQLNAVADVPGTVTYEQPAGTVLPAGTHTLAVKFIPADPQHYAPTSTTVTLTVTQATPAITWPQPAAITYGAALDTSQLNASANTAGTFTYSPAAGTVLPAGGHVLQVVFVPTDSVNYTGATASVTIDVIAPPTATITWPAPAPIAYGKPLGSAQLNATASMPGTFTYQPKAGTVLAPGTHVLQAVFTPSVGAPITATTSLTVLSQREVLLEQLAAMRALRGSAGNIGKRMQLEAAILALAGALSPRLWESDGITLDDRQGSRVFILTRLSAKISGQAARGRRSGIDDGALDAIHRALAEVDRQLAVTAIDAAGRRAKPDAKRELRAGDEDFADGRYISAMDHYGDAWEEAEEKRGRHNRHDDHDHDRDCRHGKRRGR